MRDKMKAKLSALLISLLLMVFVLNYGWSDSVDDLINQYRAVTDELPLALIQGPDFPNS